MSDPVAAPTIAAYFAGLEDPRVERTARHSLLAVAGVDGRIYAIGGYNNQGDLTTVEAYNTSTNTWSTVRPSLPTARSALGGAEGLDGRIYAISGVNSTSYLRTVEAYLP